MTGADVVDIARDGIWTLVLVAGPVMMVGLVIGVIIGLLQALTSIQEATLVYVPKILGIFVALLIAFPFMGAVLNGYMHRVMDKVIAGG